MLHKTLNNPNQTSITTNVPLKDCLNPFTAPACKISGLKKHTTHVKEDIFRPYNKSTFNSIRFDEKPLKKKGGKMASGFHISHVNLSFSSGIMAVKGLRPTPSIRSSRQRIACSRGRVRTHSEHRFPAPSSLEEGYRKPVLGAGVWVSKPDRAVPY